MYKIRTPIQISINHRVHYASQGVRPNASVHACKRVSLGPYCARVCVRAYVRVCVCACVCDYEAICVCAPVHLLIVK